MSIYPPETRSAMERLLRPRSVAIAGVSSSGGSLGGNVLANLDRFGFPGPVHVVHPTRSEISGRPCVPDTASLPEGTDCVVLAIPAPAVLAAVKGCAARGVGGVIIFAAGFAEMGPEGRAAQDEIAAIASASGMVIEGPNCLGMLNYVDGAPLTFSATDPRPPAAPGVSLVSQSGAMAATIRAALHGRTIDVAFSVSTGNEAASGVEDYIDYLLDDPMTRALALVVEHFRDAPRFLALATRARAMGKPLLLLHPGKSSAARQAAETHTGAMAGDHVVMRTVVEGAGVLVVDTLEELIDCAELVVRCKVLPFGGAAVLGESGAFKALMYDYCADLGLALPQPEGEAAEALAAVAPGLILPSNPLDLTAQPLVDPGIYAKTIEPLLADPRCGAVVLSIILSSEQMARIKMPPVVDVVRRFAPHRATIFAMLGEDAPIPAEYIDAIRAAGVPYFRSPERVMRAVAAVARWQDRAVAPPIRVAAGLALPPGVIPEVRAKAALAKAGIAMPPGRLAITLDDAKAAARELGYPVVLKVQSPALSHKSDVGGVVLGLGDDTALVAGWERLRHAVATAAPDVVPEGVLVERMAPRGGIELIVGAKRDADWGPVLMIGLGGVAAEAFHDTRVIPVNLPEPAIIDELRKLKGATLLGAFRGTAEKDVAAAAGFIRALGDFMLAHPEIAEIDINPLLVYPEGEGVLPLDALILVR